MITPRPNPATFIDEAAIAALLAPEKPPEPQRVRELLAKARHLDGLAADEVATLAAVEEPALLEELFDAARQVKEDIYGNRLVLFAPLYISNHCHNECSYCAFRARNDSLTRRKLSLAEIAAETRALIDQGHKRVLLVAGEAGAPKDVDDVLQAIDTISRTRSGRSEIRRVNVNIAPLETKDFRRLLAARIGTYQLFQETYHRATYASVHLGGRKRDYDWRLTVMDRAMEAGVEDVGIGVLFGLYDWRFELLAMMQHIRHLEEVFGVGPHTISVPRLEPATGSRLAHHPPHAVSDADFYKIIALLRLAVPYTGIIMSTRETAQVRRETFALGVSQISAGSRTDPGGYTGASETSHRAQFQLGDHRSLDEIIRDLATLGYVPSFCTACYRLGRTGADFMDLAKPGLIKRHCGPNALSSLAEYLADYASSRTRQAWEPLTEGVLRGMDSTARATSRRLLARVQAHERDVFV